MNLTAIQTAGTCSVAPRCTAGEGWDRCGVCGGAASLRPYTQLRPVGIDDGSRIGGSVATWNGSVAASQHVAQEYAPSVTSPVVTWTPIAQTGSSGSNALQHEQYVLPSREGDLVDDEAAVPPGLGYGLAMDKHHLVVGAHDSHPRQVQLWLRTEAPLPPWSWSWTANDPCPGNRFGFSVGIDERLPGDDGDDGLRGSVVAGDPGAFLSGRVYVYFTYSPGILQTLSIGNGSETQLACFGHAVDADSGLLAVGAPARNVGQFTASGTVYVYRWNAQAALQGQYELLLILPPPTNSERGGFGTAVSVWQDYLMVGDNQAHVYLYRINGTNALSQPLSNPHGTNLVSKLGYTLSVWDQLAVAGDENWIPSPSARGVSFAWSRDPLAPAQFLRTHTLHDEETSVQSRFGAAVSVRGGCIVASGVPNQPPHGGVQLANLCRDLCYGCDGVLNSCEREDQCSVCGGDGTSCVDCRNVLGGSALEDACGLCEGKNRTCVLAYTEPAAGVQIDCDAEDVVQLYHQFEAQYGGATYELVAPLPQKGTASIQLPNGYLKTPPTARPTLTYRAHNFEVGSDQVNVQVTLTRTGATALLVVPVMIGDCVDCQGVLNGPARLDECGVCEGDNSTCVGCDQTPNSGLELDYCQGKVDVFVCVWNVSLNFRCLY